jgi:hypothetical protein
MCKADPSSASFIGESECYNNRNCRAFKEKTEQTVNKIEVARRYVENNYIEQVYILELFEKHLKNLCVTPQPNDIMLFVMLSQTNKKITK